MDPSRNDIETPTPAGPAASCPVCHGAFLPVRRQRYCTAACRQAAWRARNQVPSKVAAPSPRPGHRRDVTVYRCRECDQRYLGEQWCADCNRPCTRDGLGGLCPGCDEPVTVQELLDQHQPASIQTSNIR